MIGIISLSMARLGGSNFIGTKEMRKEDGIAKCGKYPPVQSAEKPVVRPIDTMAMIWIDS
jgi:hypothetical protein